MFIISWGGGSRGAGGRGKQGEQGGGGGAGKQEAEHHEPEVMGL